MASNLFGIHWITASKWNIYDVCLAIVKPLACKSVWSASFAVLRSFSKVLEWNFQSLGIFKVTNQTIHHFICQCKVLFFSSILHLYCLSHFFHKNVLKEIFQKFRTFVYMNSSLHAKRDISPDWDNLFQTQTWKLQKNDENNGILLKCPLPVG